MSYHCRDEGMLRETLRVMGLLRFNTRQVLRQPNTNDHYFLSPDRDTYEQADAFEIHIMIYEDDFPESSSESRAGRFMSISPSSASNACRNE